MTDRERELIAAYIPSPRDEELGEYDYYVKVYCGNKTKILRGHITEIFPYFVENENRYRICTDSGKTINNWKQDGTFSMRELYDNKQDCRDGTHAWFDNWEKLREIQKAESARKENENDVTE